MGHSQGPLRLVKNAERAGHVPFIPPQKGVRRQDQMPNVTLHKLCPLYKSPFTSPRWLYIFSSRQEAEPVLGSQSFWLKHDKLSLGVVLANARVCSHQRKKADLVVQCLSYLIMKYFIILHK